MKPEAGGSWFFLVVERPDRSSLFLDKDELAAIAPEDLRAIASRMKDEGILPVLSQEGGWQALDFHEDFSPYSVPPSICALARYVHSGAVITMDNGCLPAVEWRFNGMTAEVFDG